MLINPWHAVTKFGGGVYFTMFTVHAAGAGRFLDKNLSFILLMLDTSIMQQRVPWLRSVSIAGKLVSTSA